MLDAVLGMGGSLDPYLVLDPPDFPEVIQLGQVRPTLIRNSVLNRIMLSSCRTSPRLNQELGV